tara:strand:- start:1315 stop:1500 length:186 start_codon:yes stop_codon:yes gene_type:complete
MQSITKIINDIDVFLSHNVDYETYIEMSNDLDVLRKHIRRIEKQAYLKGIKDSIAEINKKI